MAGQKTVSATYDPSLASPAQAAYHIADNPDPTFNGNYFFRGSVNGKSCYQLENGNAVIWWKPSENAWIVNKTINAPTPPWWIRANAEITGVYQPIGKPTEITVETGPTV